MALAVARNVEHETWSWPDPEVGPHPALRGLGAFAVLVGAGFGLAWSISLLVAEPPMQWLLMVAALGALGTATSSLIASTLVRRRSEARAPSSIVVGSEGLRWAGRRRRIAWDDVRSVGIGERLVERGRTCRCVIVQDADGREVWLAVDQSDEALHQLDHVLRDAWRASHGGAAHSGRARLRVLAGGRQRRTESPGEDDETA